MCVLLLFFVCFLLFCFVISFRIIFHLSEYLNIYILSVFTEKIYSKPLERNVIHIPITTLSHATNDVKIN